MATKKTKAKTKATEPAPEPAPKAEVVVDPLRPAVNSTGPKTAPVPPRQPVPVNLPRASLRFR